MSSVGRTYPLRTEQWKRKWRRKCYHQYATPFPGRNSGYAYDSCEKLEGHKGRHRGKEFEWREAGK